LILHGYTQNPQAMASYIEFFKRYDVNILTPRLAHHFDRDIRSLDTVRGQEWIDQTQEAFEAARKLGSHVIVVGYSLGGLLASRLALNPKNSRSLAALVLLSPALRLTGNVELGASVASLFSRTGNDWLKIAPPACGSATPYLSVNGGNEVVRLMRSTDPAYPGVENTIYKKIFATDLDSSKPVFLSVVPNDEVVDSAKLFEMVTPIAGRGYMTFLQFENNEESKSPHSTLTAIGLEQRSFLRKSSQTPYRNSGLFDQLADFLRDWARLDPLMF
jgi:pimeloyl-ACP methyl ester carboxylesterase